VTLAEVLRNSGFRTSAFVSSFVLDARFGLNQGFDTYDCRLGSLPLLFGSFLKRTVFSRALRVILSIEGNPLERRADVTTGNAIKWIEENGDSPFFMWIHYFDPHGPYDPPSPYRDLHLAQVDNSVEDSVTVTTLRGQKNLSWKEIEQKKLLYRGEVAYTDHYIGMFLQALSDHDLEDKTLLILTADHGESFAENNYYGHGKTLYSPSMNVPLIFYGSDRLMRGRVVEGISQTLDIMPTILDYYDIEGPDEMQGISLLPYIEKNEPMPLRSLFLETMSPPIDELKLWGLISGKWKYVMAPWGSAEELYNLSEDPGELRNLAGEIPEKAKQMKADLLTIVETSASMDMEESIELDEEAMEAMRALGYVQ
jgi:arylsulfatase A-like enzyme